MPTNWFRLHPGRKCKPTAVEIVALSAWSAQFHFWIGKPFVIARKLAGELASACGPGASGNGSPRGSRSCRRLALAFEQLLQQQRMVLL